MLKLAEQYASLLNASILSHRMEGNSIIFVLSSGPKLTMTETELKKNIEELTPQAGAKLPAATPKPKKEK